MGCGTSSDKGERKRDTRQVSTSSATSRRTSRRGSLQPTAGDRAGAYSAPEVSFELLEAKAGHQPSARKMHSAARVGNHSVIIFGGMSRKDAFNSQDDLEASLNFKKMQISKETFRVALSGPTWHKINMAGETPNGRASHRAVTVENNMYLFGTHNKKCCDVYAFNVAFGTWRKLPSNGNPPRSTGGHSLVPASKSLIVFAGESDYGINNELHAYNVETGLWTLVPPRGPLIGNATTNTEVNKALQPRRDHSAVIIDEKMYVFGGFAVVSDDLAFIEFDARKQEWRPVPCVNTPPPNRGAHVASSFDAFMIIFGGQRHKTFLNDLHVFNTLTGVWTPVALSAGPTSFIPSPRAFAAMTVIQGIVYVHGGGDDAHIFSDFFRFGLRDVVLKADPCAILDDNDEPLPDSPLWDQLD